MTKPSNADAWGLERVVDFFDTERTTTGDVYPSEWIFLKEQLRAGMSLLDVGCAQGGFASVAAEHIAGFRYTGVDINAQMIERARERHPGHVFHHVPEGDLAVLGDAQFDLVLVLGILHLHEKWRDTIAAAWAHTGGALLLDLRETQFASVEDKAVSYFRMDFNGGDTRYEETTLPYNLINSADALDAVIAACPGARGLRRYGYLHPVSGAAVTPIETVMTSVYLVER